MYRPAVLPNMKAKGWDAFHELVKSRYGESDPFSKVLELTAPFLQLIRNARDCLEHGNLNGVKTSDFEPPAIAGVLGVILARVK